LSLDQIAGGARIFIDAPIFVYHFTGSSTQCRNVLERCERGELDGVTSVTVLAEVTHRLMMLEAVSAGLIRAGNVARKLRERPEVIRKLAIASEQTARIPLMGIDVLGLELRLVLSAAEYRRKHGLMTNDSIIVATIVDAGITDVATADRDFGRVDGLVIFEPRDLVAV
jgi:predicted nucleic acid-binding protein